MGKSEHIYTLPRIEYLGQETDFQMYQAVREGVEIAIKYLAMNPETASHWVPIAKVAYENWHRIFYAGFWQEPFIK